MPSSLRAVFAAVLLSACEAKAPPPTPTEAARAALADLDAANVKLNIEFTGVSAISDPVYTTGARAQADVSFMSTALPADGDVQLITWLILQEATQAEAEDLAATLDQMNDQNDEKHNKRDALAEMLDLTDALRDALATVVAEARAGGDGAPTSTRAASLTAATNLPLGHSQSLLIQAKGDVSASFDCPDGHDLDGQLDLIDLATGEVLQTGTTWPILLQARVDTWSSLRVTGRWSGGDSAVDALAACQVQVDHRGPADAVMVDLTGPRLDSFTTAGDDAVRALRLARAEVAKLYAAQTLSDDEVVAFSAVLSGYESRMLAMGVSVEVGQLTQDDLSWLNGQSDLQDQVTLRLQTVLDHREKFLNTLSNVLKDVATTQDALTAALE